MKDNAPYRSTYILSFENPVGEEGQGEKGEGEKGEGDNGGKLSPRKVLLFFPVIGEGERSLNGLPFSNSPSAGTQYQSTISWYTIPIGR
jgi:hypothetical protein